MLYLPSTWKRLMAHFFDRTYVGILQAPVYLTVFFDYLRSGHVRLSWPHLLYVILVSIAYDTLSLYFFSTTLGKSQWKLRVVNRTSATADSKMGIFQVLTRVLTSRLSFYFGWSVYALAFFRYNRTHLSDWVAGTQVVSTVPRKSLPRIRWVLATGFIIMMLGETVRSTAITLDLITWQRPFFYFEGSQIKKLLEDIEFAAQIEGEDED